VPNEEVRRVELELAEAIAELDAAAEDEPIELARKLREVGRLHTSRLEAEPALAALRRARAISEREGDAYGAAAADDFLGLLLCHLGNPGGALPLHLAAAEKFAALRQEDDECESRSWASWALVELGRAEEALALSRQAVALCNRPDVVAGLIVALADCGLLDEAAKVQAEMIAGRTMFTTWEARAMGHLAKCQGDDATAMRMFSFALEKLEEEGDLAELHCSLRQAKRLGITEQELMAAVAERRR